ncbi:MAG: FMN-dependent NADH-azoreductase [Acutalibacteraceae bacterium]|jgi:FMN-dependent NADH-azoreductase
MSKVLVITSSPRSEAVSTYLAAEFANMLKTDDIEFFDVSQIDFPIYDEKLLQKFENPNSLSTQESEFYDDIMNQFIEADRLVFAFPNWNLICPPSIVSFMLCACRTGVTFKYSETGESIGLLEGKKALIILSCGGKYVENETFFGVSWLRGALALNGITDVSEVVADLIEVRRDEQEEIKQEALEKLEEIAKTFLD